MEHALRQWEIKTTTATLSMLRSTSVTKVSPEEPFCLGIVENGEILLRNKCNCHEPEKDKIRG